MGKILSRSSANVDPRPGRYRPGHPVIPVIGVTLVVWLVLGGLAAAERRTYEVASLRTKEPRGHWGLTRTGEKRYVSRLETAGGRWALETSGPDDEKAEGLLYGKLLDSSAMVLWEGELGDRSVLSTTAPAFATYSTVGSGVKIYNLQVGTEPVFIDSATHVDRVFQSPDGTVFGVIGVSHLNLVSTRGGVVGAVPLRDSCRVLCASMSDSGRYVAVGEWRMEGVHDPSGGAQTDGRKEDTQDTARNPGMEKSPPTRLRAPDSIGLRGNREQFSPARLQTKVTYQGISVYDRTGHRLGQFSVPRGWWLPRRLVLSEETPPQVGVATDFGVSLWTCQGQVVWEDSVAFGRVSPPAVVAILMTKQNHLLAITRGGSDSVNLWAWDETGTLEDRRALPQHLRELPAVTWLYMCPDNSAEIQTASAAATIEWSRTAK